MRPNPYDNLPAKAFWKLAVAQNNPLDINNLWDPKFDLRPNHKVVTFGSCFAQHIGKALNARRFNWLVTEPSPHGLSDEHARAYQYDVFSARTGNIYTTSSLNQWTQWALNSACPPDESWQQDGRWFDPFRPSIEPGGFISEQEMLHSRDQAIKSFRACIEGADYFVFTLGLTESWRHTELHHEYPICPGTLAGEYDPEQHTFANLSFSQIKGQLIEAMETMWSTNKRLRFILTVSPVPLTATMSGNHVLTATIESKSTLRAVAGELSKQFEVIDYFPAYEIINSPVFRGMFFEPNLRSVNQHGVNLVMDHFFNALSAKFGALEKTVGTTESKVMEEICDEVILEAFGRS